MQLLEAIFQSRHRKKSGFVLALGGGGGRGLAHLGVMDVLEQHHLRPDAIIGSSIGAMFGAMYALTPDATDVRRRVLEILNSESFSKLDLTILGGEDNQDQSWLGRMGSAARQALLYTRAATDRSIADTDLLIEIVSSFCGGNSFDEAEIPIYVTAVAFPSGECHLFSATSGVSLPCAVAASMAIPGVFEPVVIDGNKYVDGGVASELPAKEAQMLASADQLVLAVNVGVRPPEDEEPANVYAMRDWAAQIQSLYLRKDSKSFADVLIEPLVGYRQWLDFSNVDQEIERGRQAALAMMPELIGKLER